MTTRATLSTALATTLLAASPAHAEPVNVTAQAKAARAEFLFHATPPGPVATICLVDTGVNQNPDTTAVIDRLALEGPVSDLSPSLHGTQMAMYIGAPANGYGMVGLWPAARIVSVRANIAGEDAFTAAGYVQGVKRCDEAAKLHNVKVIAIPIASPITLQGEEALAFEAEVDAAQRKGVNLVAAAGNVAGQPGAVPGSHAGVLSVGASNSASGALCPFSATGSRLLAPGCGLDGAAPDRGMATSSHQGTSYSAVLAATALAALRTWRPDLDAATAERLVTDNARTSVWGRRLDVTAAFVAAGLSTVVAGPASQPPAASDDRPPTTPSPGARKLQLPKPRLVVSRGRGATRMLRIRVANRPRGAALTVRVYDRTKRGALRHLLTQTKRASTIQVRARVWKRVTAFYTDPSGRQRRSSTAAVNAPR